MTFSFPDNPHPSDWNPEELNALVAGYVLGDLSSDEMARFQELLMVYPELAKEVASLQEALSMLPYGLPPQQPDSQVRSRLLAKVQAESTPTGEPPEPILVKPKQPLTKAFPLRGLWKGMLRRRSWRTWAIASAMVAFGGYGLWQTHRVSLLQAQLEVAENFVEMAIANDFTSGPQLTVSPADSLVQHQWSGLSQLVQDHLRSVGRSRGPVDIIAATPDALRATTLPISETLPTLATPQAQLLGGSPCHFGEARGVRLTYQLPADQTVSVYQIELNGDQFPEFLETHVTLSDHPVNLIVWRDQNHLYAVAAKLPLTDLQTLAQTMEPI